MKILFSLFFIITSFSYAQPNVSNYWELTNGPFGQKITTVDILNQDSILVGTNGAGVFLYQFSTASWENVYSKNDFNDIYSSLVTQNKDVLFSAKGYNNKSTIIKFNKSLNSWKMSESYDVGKFAEIKDTNNNFIIFITQWNGIWKSEDNGENWNNMEVNLFGLGLKDVKYDTTLNRIILATNGGIADQAFGKTSGLENGILFSDDLGQSYYNVLKGAFDNVLINQKGLLLAIQDNIILARSLNDGSTWEEISTQNYFITKDITISLDSILYAVNKEGFFISLDYGTTWELINHDVKNLIKIESIDDSTFYVSSTNDLFYYSTISNKYVKLTDGLYASNIWSLFASGNNTIFAGGKNGTIYYSENFGTSWNTAPRLETSEDCFVKDINTFLETSSGRLFVGTDLPFFYYSDNILVQWNKVRNIYFNDSPEILSMAVNSKDEIYVGTSNEGIVIINEDASEFRTTQILGQYILSLDIDENDEVYAGSLYGTVFFTTENATNWQAKSDGLNKLPVVSVKKAIDNLYACTIESIYKYNELTQYWDDIGTGLPESIVLSQMLVIDNTIYLSSRGNGIYFTSDEGKNWNTFNTGLDNKDITAIVSDSSGYLYVASSKGIYKTNDKIVSVYTQDNNSFPSELALNNVYPNPFNSTTNISFSNTITQNIVIKVYNLLGEEIKTITNNKFAPGVYSYSWNGTNKLGVEVNSGIYLIRLESNNKNLIKKIILLK